MTDTGVALPAGTRLDGLEIAEVLGSGGFGVTYLARDVSLDVWRAVKEYFPLDWGARRADGTIGARTPADDEAYRWGLERFLEEARILARFDHRHLVRVYRVFEARGTAYMVTEYVDGQTLASEAAAGPLTEARVREILAGLADGLAEVHKAGLLHRDIKPGNVVVRGDGTPVLIDFGSARQAMGRHSRSVTAVLTPGYAPIEQYSARGHQGPWTDIYSLGALAYWALSGEVPDDATERVRADRLLPVAQAARTRVTARLAAAVDAALAVNELDRPQDLEEWLAALEGPPLDWVPKGRQETTGRRSQRAGRDSARVPKWWRKRPVLVGAALMVALLVVASGVLWDGSESNSGENGPDRTDTEPPVAVTNPETVALEPGEGRVADLSGEEGTGRAASVTAESGTEDDRSSVSSVSAENVGIKALDSTEARPQADATSKAKPPRPASVLGGSAILIAETTPPGAEVLLDGTLVGKTPLQRSDIRAGVRLVTLRHPHCETMRILNRSFEDGVVLRVDRELQRGVGRLTVLVTAPQAWVEVEGARRAERTPVTLEDIPAGPVEVRLGAPEHRALSVEVEIPMNGMARLERDLERIPHGSLTLELEPPGASVMLPDSGVLYRPGVRLPEGTHRVVVASLGYHKADRTVEVSGSTQLRIALERRYGTLTLDLEPPGAAVTLPDSAQGYRSGVRLPEGSYRVVVRSEGYQKAERTVRVSGSTQVRIALERSAGVSEVFDVGGTEMEFAWIPAGEFQMGSTSAEADDDERPVRPVRISHGYWLGKYEVTQGQWEAVTSKNPSRFKACGSDCPVENVSWNDVQNFLRRLNDRADGMGGSYRLPTEAEWEYAARAGTTGDTHGGDLRILGRSNAPILDGIAWYSGNSGVMYSKGSDCSGWDEKQYSSSRCGPHPVGGKRANAWGLHDMIGNVWEWVQDRYGAYPGGAVTDPVGVSRGRARVDRGGGWNTTARGCRSANRRGGGGPGTRNNALGFRVVRTE